MKVPCRTIFLALTLGVAAWAQSFTGAISGRVTDPSSAGVARAKIAAIEETTNVTTDSVADDQGDYAFPSLRPGPYRLEVEASGFKKLVRSGLAVQVNSRIRVDLVMSLGAISERVDVSGAQALVETDSSALGNVVSNRQILNLPLNTRNPFQLAGLSPGVIPSVGLGNQFNTSADFMIGGGRGNTSEVLIDGITNSVPAANPIAVIAMFPSVDAIEEFKVQTSAYAAEYGRSGGGIVNMIIRSGTNQYHGTLFEFLRNSKMDSNSFFANRSGSPLASFKRNQYGFSFGGPILHDKLFFFVNYEALRQRSQSNTTLTVPTALERQGDFRQTRAQVGSACSPIQLFDPLTTQAVTGGFARDPFPNAVIPATRQDPVGAKLATYFPLPNLPGTGCSGINNYFASLSAPVTTNQMDMKFDWAPSVVHKFTAGLSWRTYDDPTPNAYGTIAQPGNYDGDSIPSKGMRLDYTGTYSPTLILNGRFGITRLEREDPPNPYNFSLAQLGFAQNFASQMVTPVSFPNVTAAGYSGLGQAIAFVHQAGTSYSFNGNLTKVHGDHTIKAGVDYRINQSFEFSGFSTNGNFGFTQGFTQGPDPNRPAAGAGNSIASMLLGVGTGDMAILPGRTDVEPLHGFVCAGRLQSVAQADPEPRTPLRSGERTHGAVRSAELFRFQCPVTPGAHRRAAQSARRPAIYQSQ